jgi:hypothetical protein
MPIGIAKYSIELFKSGGEGIEEILDRHGAAPLPSLRGKSTWPRVNTRTSNGREHAIIGVRRRNIAQAQLRRRS